MSEAFVVSSCRWLNGDSLMLLLLLFLGLANGESVRVEARCLGDSKGVTELSLLSAA